MTITLLESTVTATTSQVSPIVSTIQRSPVVVSLADVGVSGVGVPSGGLKNEVLVKSSNTDYDTEWTDTLDEITMNGGYF
jgi:hypothetical protein